MSVFNIMEGHPIGFPFNVCPLDRKCGNFCAQPPCRRSPQETKGVSSSARSLGSVGLRPELLHVEKGSGWWKMSCMLLQEIGPLFAVDGGETKKGVGVATSLLFGVRLAGERGGRAGRNVGGLSSAETEGYCQNRDFEAPYKFGVPELRGPPSHGMVGEPCSLVWNLVLRPVRFWEGFHQIGLGVGDVVCSVGSACAAGNIPQMVEAVCSPASCWTKTFWTKMHGSSLGGCGANAGLCKNSRCNVTRRERAREWERALGKSRGRGVGSSAMRASSFLMVSSPKGGLLE